MFCKQYSGTVLLGRSEEEIKCKLELCEEAFKSHGLCLVRHKMEYKKEGKLSKKWASTVLTVKIGN